MVRKRELQHDEEMQCVCNRREERRWKRLEVKVGGAPFANYLFLQQTHDAFNKRVRNTHTDRSISNAKTTYESLEATSSWSPLPAWPVIIYTI